MLSKYLIHMTAIFYNKEDKNRFKVLMTLTDREYQCVELLSQGNTSKSIAKKLNISHRTVEAHFGNIMHKFRCRNRYDILKIYFSKQ